jgi:hypothetical protein
MALPPAAPSRQLEHARSVDVQVFSRRDGLWEIDARLTDTKAHDWALADGGTRPAGTPIHDMLLRLVIDARMQILEAGAQTDWVPYPGQCDQHADLYGRLVGLNLLNGFRRALKERLGGVQGCTHLTELAQVLPTAVIQAFAGETHRHRGAEASSEAVSSSGEQPFQIDRCHALRSDGEVVRLHYPRWYREPAAHNAALVAPDASSGAGAGEAKQA